MCTVGAIQKVGSESSQSLTFYNHREGPYEGLLLVKSATRRLLHDCKSFVSSSRRQVSHDNTTVDYAGRDTTLCWSEPRSGVQWPLPAPLVSAAATEHTS